MRTNPWPTITVFVAILIILPLSGSAASKCPIVFEARPNKDSILPFESAFIWLKARNDGDTAAHTNPLNFLFIRVTAINLETGDTVPCPTGDGCMAGPDTSSDRHLGPGKEYLGYDLLIGPRFEYLAGKGRDARTGFTPWPTGRIQVELRYWHNPWEESRNAPCSMIFDTITFEVVEESPIDVKALEAIGSARSVFEPGKRMDALWSVILTHGGSPYASLAAYDIAIQLNCHVRRPFQPSVRELCTALAGHCPLDGNVGVTIVGLLGTLRPRARRPIMEEILSSLPDPSGIRRILGVNFDKLGRWRGARKW